MDICYASNEAYVPYLAVSLSSCITAHEQEKEALSFHIIANGISAESRETLRTFSEAHGHKIWFYDLSDLSSRVPEDLDTGNYDLSMLGRFFMGELLPEDVRRVLYLDCDTVVEKSLAPLFRDPLPCAEKPILYGVPEPTIYPSILRQLGLSDYINSGVLLVNLAAWRSASAGERLLRFYCKNGGHLYCGDQDAINFVLQGRIGFLPPEWNFFTNYRYFRYEKLVSLCPGYRAVVPNRRAFLSAKRSPCILHYMGAERPWIRGNRNPYRNAFRRAKERSPFGAYPEVCGQERFMLKYHMMNLATLCLPPVRDMISRYFEKKEVLPRLRNIIK